MFLPNVSIIEFDSHLSNLTLCFTKSSLNISTLKLVSFSVTF